MTFSIDPQAPPDPPKAPAPPAVDQLVIDIQNTEAGVRKLRRDILERRQELRELTTMYDEASGQLKGLQRALQLREQEAAKCSSAGK